MMRPKESGSCESNKKVDFTYLLTSAGGLGRYQIILACVTFPFYLFLVWSHYSQIFVTQIPQNYWCWTPELSELSPEQRRKLSIPPDKTSLFGYSNCKTYVTNWTDVLLSSKEPNATWKQTSCRSGWEFNKTEIPYPTISTDMEWVCDKGTYAATAQAVFSIGSIGGSIIIGLIADRYGRIVAAVISNLIGCVGGTASAFARNFLEFNIGRFIHGIAYDNCRMMVYITVLEYIAPKYRSLVSNISFAVFYTVAVTSLPWIVLACGHWRITLLATSVPMALAVFTPLIVPESPSWLLSKGRVEDAVKNILLIGRVNKKSVPTNVLKLFKASEGKYEEDRASALDLFKRPILRKMFIILCLEFTFCTLVFETLVRTIDQLDFDYFVSFSIISVTEFPATIMLAFFMDSVGRRWFTFVSMFWTSIFCILSTFIKGWPSIACAWLARFGINLSTTIAVQWSAETLPVSVRGAGVSIIHTCGFIATIIAPYIVYIKTFYYWLPSVMIGIASVLCAVIVLSLPETANKPMPQTFEDAENAFVTQTFWDIPCTKKVRKNNNKCENN